MSSRPVLATRSTRTLQATQASDPVRRYQIYGRIQPMDEPGLFARLFRRR